MGCRLPEIDYPNTQNPLPHRQAGFLLTNRRNAGMMAALLNHLAVHIAPVSCGFFTPAFQAAIVSMAGRESLIQHPQGNTFRRLNSVIEARPPNKPLYAVFLLPETENPATMTVLFNSSTGLVACFFT